MSLGVMYEDENIICVKNTKLIDKSITFNTKSHHSL